MNKIGLRKAVYPKIKKAVPKLTKVQIHDILDIILTAIGDSLVDTKRLSIRDLGVLEITYLKERNGWHPKKQIMITIPARAKVKFTPSGKMAERLKNS